jgi:hypothetical protein
MKRLTAVLASTALLTLTSGAMAENCPDRSASNTATQTTGSVSGQAGSGQISKDGTHAPLETQKNAAGVTESQTGTTQTMAKTGQAAGGVSKDGKTMPLANSQGGGDTNLAMSQQDVTAQQKGGGTAAATMGECQ